MENSSLLRFACEIPEALFDHATTGFELPLHVYAAGADLHEKDSEVAPSASAGTRTFWVKLDLPAVGSLRVAGT